MAQLSHAWIVASPSEALRMRRATELAAALVCRQQGRTACGQCGHCRKAFAGIHPDIITIAREAGDDASPRKELYVHQIRALCLDACVLPNEAARKVYLIAEADKMNESAQNALLKLLEEPPEHAALILCTASLERLLPTVRSRCAVCLQASGGSEPEPEAEADALRLLRSVAGGERAALFAECMACSGSSSQQALALFECAQALCVQMLGGQRDAMGLSRQRLAHLQRLFAKMIDWLHVNTNVKQIFGLVAVTALK